MRARKFSSASTSVRPMFCSCSVRRTSPASGSLTFVEASRSDCGKLRPASSVTTIRSIRSGRPFSICSLALADPRVDDERSGGTSRGAATPIVVTRTNHAGRPASWLERRARRSGSTIAHEALHAEQALGRRRVHARRRSAASGSRCPAAARSARRGQRPMRAGEVVEPRARRPGRRPCPTAGSVPAKPYAPICSIVSVGCRRASRRPARASSTATARRKRPMMRTK